MNQGYNQFRVEFSGSYLIEFYSFSVMFTSVNVSNSKSYIITYKIYRLLVGFVQIWIVVGQKLLLILIAVPHLFTSLLKCYPGLLFLYMSHKLYWVTAPYLHWWHYSSWWNHTVWQYYSTLFNDGTFKNYRIIPNEGSLLEDARVKSWSVMDHDIVLNFDMSGKTWWSRSGSVEDTVISNKYIGMNPTLNQ